MMSGYKDSGLTDKQILAVEYLDAGFAYRWPKEGEPNYPMAIKCLEKAAELGNLRAMGDLGIIYEELGDFEMSYKWRLEAALGGDGASIWHIGMLYHKGEYVCQDYKRAYHYFYRAYELGFPFAALFLGLYAEEGYINPSNRNEALYYYLIGKEMRVRDCENKLIELGYTVDVEFLNHVNNNKQAVALENKIKNGTSTEDEVRELADITGGIIYKMIIDRLHEEYPDGRVTEDEVRWILSPIMRENHKYISWQTGEHIRHQDLKKGINTEIYYPKYDDADEDELIKIIVDRGNR